MTSVQEEAQAKLRRQQYQAYLAEISKEYSYIIPVIASSGPNDIILDPLDSSANNKKIKIYKNWEYKEYERHKILVSDYKKCEQLLMDFEEVDEEDIEERSNKLITLYQFMAQCYLKMSPKEFLRASWKDIRTILDACHYRTNHSIADMSRNIYSYFHLEVEVTLTYDEHEAITKYRLWTGKAKTPPWIYNGGHIYQEDLNEVLKMEALEISGRNFRERKAQKGGGSGNTTTMDADGTRHTKTTKYKER